MTPLDPMERAQIIVWCILFSIVFVFGLYVVFKTEDTEQPPRFQVVDKYENCDVIRYTDSTQRWNYFLKCNE